MRVNANFLHKNSPTLLNDLRDFMVANFGFGDFVFRLPNNEEVDRASTLEQFVNGIQTIPVNSLLFHANSHHFSNWIAARTEFRLASRLRKIFAHDFKDGELLRNHLIKELNLNIDNSKDKVFGL